MGFNFFFETINNKMGVSQEGQEAIYILLQEDWDHEKIKKAVCLNEDDVEKYLKKHRKESTQITTSTTSNTTTSVTDTYNKKNENKNHKQDVSSKKELCTLPK